MLDPGQVIESSPAIFQIRTRHPHVEQGVEMGRPSRLHIEVDKRSGALAAVRVGGSSVIVSEGSFTLPS